MNDDFMRNYYMEHYGGFTEELKDAQYAALDKQISVIETEILKSVDAETAKIMERVIYCQLELSDMLFLLAYLKGAEDAENGMTRKKVRK